MTQTTSMPETSIQALMLRLTDIDEVFEEWPRDRSPHLDWLRDEAKKWIAELAKMKWLAADPKVAMRKLKSADLALYVTNVYPEETNKEVLRHMLHVHLWMFLWDHQTDIISAELPENSQKKERAQVYRKKTLQDIRFMFRLTDQPGIAVDGVVDTSISTIVSTLMRASEQGRKAFCDSLEQAIESLAEDSEDHLDLRLPAKTGWLKFRGHTKGVSACHILHWALIDSDIYAIENPDVRPLIHRATVITVLLTNILSLLKKIHSQTTMYEVPDEWLQDPQKALDHAFELLSEAKRDFDREEFMAISMSRCPKEKLDELLRFVKALKTQVTGSHAWGLRDGFR